MGNEAIVFLIPVMEQEVATRIMVLALVILVPSTVSLAGVSAFAHVTV